MQIAVEEGENRSRSQAPARRPRGVRLLHIAAVS